MDSKFIRYYTLFFICCTFSCEQISVQEISGSWKLLEVFDEGDSIAFDLSVACLDITNDHTFNYRLTEQEQLHGTYKLDNDILNLWCQNPVDTIRVQILTVTDDHMTLRMNHDGTERKIGLSKLATIPSVGMKVQ